jgi:small-conductance mechanosensitive channel
MSLLSDPTVHEALVSLLILAASYFAARLLSYLFGRLLARAARTSVTSLDDRLVAAVKKPVTYALFLVGCYAAVHRSPLPDTWTRRIDETLFVLSVVLITLALVRSYAIFIEWYTTHSPAAAASGTVTPFGPLLSKIGRAIIALLAMITILQHLGVNVASLVVSLGVGSLAVGLAAQDTLANLFAGFTLTLDQPFRVGERIQLTTGEVGDVEVIGIRSTRIRTTDETIVVVPNAVLTKDRLVNLSRPTRRLAVRVDLNVPYGTDLDQARSLLLAAAAGSEYVDREASPSVVVTQLADGGVGLRLGFQATDYTQSHLARSQVLEAVYKSFAESGIEAPSPAMRIISGEVKA